MTGRMRLRMGTPLGDASCDLGEVHQGWQLCRFGDKWKVYSTVQTAGSANYTFRVNRRTHDFDTHANIDAKKLRTERPEVYRAVQKYLRTFDFGESQTDEQADPYGDIALSRRQRLTVDHLWRRGLLQLRMRDLEILAKTGEHGTWAPCVELLFRGVFKAEIKDTVKHNALDFVLSYGADRVNLDALIQVEEDYYARKYDPNACQTLTAQFDLLTAPPAEEEPPADSNGDISDLL